MKTLEERLGETLRFEAEQLPGEDAAHTLTPVSGKGSGFLRPGLAAPVALVAVMVVAAPVIWLSAGRGGGGQTPAATPITQATPTETSQPTATTNPDSAPGFGGQLGEIIDQLPDRFDLDQASAVFATDTTLEETALRYLETRHLADGVGISRVVEQDGYTMVQWAWGRLLDGTGVEQGERGWLVMRPADGGYEVLAATTDGIDLSDVVQTSTGHIIGDVISDTDQHLGVDILDLDGTPVASAPNPEGMPDADFVWGTAASGTSPLGFDVEVSGAVLLRVNRVGGSLLSISEIALGQVTEDELDKIQDDGAPTDTLREPTSEDWTDLPAGLSVAVVEEANGRPRIWVKSAVQEPAPAPSTDIAFLLVPVSETEVAVLIPNPGFFGIPISPEADGGSGDEPTAPDSPESARIHWGFQDSVTEIVSIDWESDSRFGVALVEAREADIVDVEYLANP
jgi:hypothetical protein